MRAKSKRERLFKVSWFIGQEQETVLDARLERADAVDEPNNEEFSQLFATIKIFAGICDAVLERRTQTVLPVRLCPN